MIRIGLTGGIGSGKSTVARVMISLGIPCYDSDRSARYLMETDRTIISGLENKFGTEIYKGGRLDRELLAGIVFSDPRSLENVNSIVHPAVGEDFRLWSGSCQSSGHDMVLLESAILFDSGFNMLVDTVIAVTAPQDVRICRLISSRGIGEEEVRDRIRNQIQDGELARLSDHIIINDGTTAVLPQLNRILKSLKNDSRI